VHRHDAEGVGSNQEGNTNSSRRLRCIRVEERGFQLVDEIRARPTNPCGNDEFLDEPVVAVAAEKNVLARE